MAPTARLCCFMRSFILRAQRGSGHATTALQWHELCRTFHEAPRLHAGQGHRQRQTNALRGGELLEHT